MNYVLLANTASKSEATDFGWGISASWIALVVAIISPVLVAIITNRHQVKMKKAEILESRGLVIIEEYLDVICFKVSRNGGASEQYNKCYAKIFLYAPKYAWNDIEELDSLIRNTPKADFPDEQECRKLIKKISKELTYTNISL